MSNIFRFGEKVAGYDIPVLNEREIRAGAGILFLLMFVSIYQAASKGDFTLLKYAIVIFLADIVIRLFISPRFAPALILGRIFVRNQNPEYVGAPQKQFAWIIGLVLGSIMLALQIIANTYSPITGLICLICLVFLFFESAFGICIGCKLYALIYREKAQYCPGEVCDLNARQEIQKISWPQLLVVLAFAGYIFATVAIFHDNFKEQPSPLFGQPAQQQTQAP